MLLPVTNGISTIQYGVSGSTAIGYRGLQRLVFKVLQIHVTWVGNKRVSMWFMIYCRNHKYTPNRFWPVCCRKFTTLSKPFNCRGNHTGSTLLFRTLDIILCNTLYYAPLKFVSVYTPLAETTHLTSIGLVENYTNSEVCVVFVSLFRCASTWSNQISRTLLVSPTISDWDLPRLAKATFQVVIEPVCR